MSASNDPGLPSWYRPTSIDFTCAGAANPIVTYRAVSPYDVSQGSPQLPMTPKPWGGTNWACRVQKGSPSAKVDQPIRDDAPTKPQVAGPVLAITCVLSLYAIRKVVGLLIWSNRMRRLSLWTAVPAGSFGWGAEPLKLETTAKGSLGSGPGATSPQPHITVTISPHGSLRLWLFAVNHQFVIRPQGGR